ncbi:MULTISPECIES: ribosome hibernation-promoting factor, HPF/YfiA family [unclassified Salinibacterium]|uniref:ribosome hibernation-promoting factor, HPF/YfiA family n=1 Tax=unclassified Salinibacterium TaxID=2632331 RepID=UPI0018CDFABE|nr:MULTISPECIES: ribosome-associated translation inhibitor RaiA [unclassified Salinibacterium]MBH0053606.1 ribosome-associated translation inhibitor RaiA [Salinibacterium sp. SWN139]MBH0082881.1 ribosome-associated translation inhibitor RaiA [Salinibacterium sp. SWN167]
MEITVNGRNVGVTDRFREYAIEKSEKVSHLAEKAIAFEIKVTRHHETKGSSGDDRVELTLIGPGPLVRAEAAGSDKYVAFDLAMAKLVERIRQSKDRKKVHRGNHRPTSLREASAGGFAVVDITPASPDVIEKVATGAIPIQGEEAEPGDEDYSPVVIRRKVFPSSHMTVEEALDHMELVGHDFFLFVDSQTDRPSVVYRRKGWDYGVIALEEEADDVVPSGRSRKRKVANG